MQEDEQPFPRQEENVAGSLDTTGSRQSHVGYKQSGSPESRKHKSPKCQADEATQEELPLPLKFIIDLAGL